jgi:NADPH-dependent curcumin reductase CurA
MIIAMRIKLQGFIVFDYVKRYAEARMELAQWLSEGKIKRKETIIKGGLKVADKALADLYKGINTGMSLVAGKDGGRLGSNHSPGKLLLDIKAHGSSSKL